MRELSFLVTNDDGVESPLLAALVEAMRSCGRVTVVAPETEKSWIGKAISRHHRLRARACDERFGCPAWAVDGTPADCVNLGLGHLAGDRVDMVVSGINMGSNAGIALILASGTVGGALEGALHGLHAVASSIRLSKADFERIKATEATLPENVRRSVSIIAERTAEIAARVARRARPRSFLVHNLNFPPETSAETPLESTVPAAFPIGTLWVPTGDERTFEFAFSVGDERPGPHLSDRACLDSGRASYSVLDFGRIGAARRPRISRSRPPAS